MGSVLLSPQLETGIQAEGVKESELPSILKSGYAVRSSRYVTVMNTLRACGLRLGMRPLKSSWWLGSTTSHLNEGSLMVMPSCFS